MGEDICILLVEDNPGDADLIRELLPETGPHRFEVKWVQRLAEVFPCLCGSIDLIVLDLGLPDSVGLDTLRAVLGEASEIPIVVLTGNDDEQAGIEAVKTGAQDYLIKGNVSMPLLTRVFSHALERHRTKLRLVQSERFLRATLDGLSAHIAIVNDQGRIVAINAAWRRFATENGTDPDRVGIGKDYLGVCEQASGDDRQAAIGFSEGIRAVLAGRAKTFEMDYPCHSPNQERWFCGRVTPFRGNGRPGVVVAHEDITGRKQAERALQESEDLFRRVFDTSPNCVFIKDAHGHYLMVNQAMAELYGTSCKAMLGRTDADFVARGRLRPEEADFLATEDRKVVQQGLARAVAEGFLTPSDGPTRCFHTIRCPLPLDSNPDCMLGIAVDITAQKNAQEALTDSELRLRTILDAQKKHVVLHDLSMNIVWPNLAACRSAGLSREELIGRSCRGVWQYAETTCQACPVVSAIKTGKACQSIQKWSDGSTWRVMGYPVKDAGGRLVHALRIAEDITERRELEEQLRHAQKMESIGVLAGGIAHDFNNILSAIIGYTDLALIESGLSLPLKDNLEEVARAGQRAKKLVAQILAFSRQMENEMSPVQVSLIVNEAVKLLKATLPATISVQKNVFSTAEIMADPTQIHQVTMNLCTNAYHAMRENGGTLAVELVDVELDETDIDPTQPVKPGPYIRLRVRDTGSGMDESIRSRIFEPYFTTKAKGEGTGLGLAVVYGIIQTHGGMTTVASQPGEGSTFQIFLPRIVGESSSQEEDQVAEQLPGGTERIMVIDDEPPVSKVLQRILSQHGYRVDRFTDPHEALARFRQGRDHFDLVITDMTMPKITGDVLAVEMMRIRPNLPVIVCTGFSEKIDPARAEEAGIQALIIKPFDRSSLVQKVRQVLDDGSAPA